MIETMEKKKESTKRLGVLPITFGDEAELNSEIKYLPSKLKRFIYAKYPLRPLPETLVCDFGACDGIYMAYLIFSSADKPPIQLDEFYHEWLHDNIEELIRGMQELCGYLPEFVELIDGSEK